MDCLVVSVLCLMVSVEELGTCVFLCFGGLISARARCCSNEKDKGAWADQGSVSDPCTVVSVLLYLSCIDPVSLSFGDNGI